MLLWFKFAYPLLFLVGLGPDGSVGKEPACNAGDEGNVGSIPGLGRSPGGGNGNPLQYSCLECSMNRGAWQATVHGGHKDLDTLNMYAWLWGDVRGAWFFRPLTLHSASAPEISTLNGRGIKGILTHNPPPHPYTTSILPGHVTESPWCFQNISYILLSRPRGDLKKHGFGLRYNVVLNSSSAAC